MRSFPATPFDLTGNESLKLRTKSSPKISPEEISRIKSDAIGANDLSSASIESEFKRIEALLTNVPDSFLKEFGATLGRLEKTRDASEFNTASFASKEEIRLFGNRKLSPKLTSRETAKTDFIPFGEFHSNILNGYIGYGASPNETPQNNLNKNMPKTATFKERLQMLKADKKATASILSRSETEGDRLDTESTFGVRRIVRADTETGKQMWITDKKFVLPENPRTKAELKKEKQQVKFQDQLEQSYDCEESSLDIIEADLRIKSAFLRSADDRQRIYSQNLSIEGEEVDIDSFLKHLMVPRKMKISIGGIPFQDVIFVLALKFFDKSAHFENFVFEWTDLKTGVMVGYIKCDYIKYVHKQSPRRFNIACRGSDEDKGGKETLHHVHVETEAPVMCDLYVNGLNAVAKYMHRNLMHSS